MFDPSELLLDPNVLPTLTRLTDALEDAEDSAAAHRIANRRQELGFKLLRLGQIRLMIGDTPAPVNIFLEADTLIEQTPEAQLSEAQALCYAAQYDEAYKRFDQGMASLSRYDSLLRGFYLLSLGSLYYADLAQHDRALASLQEALPLLQAEKSTYGVAACMISTADAFRASGQFESIDGLLGQADEIMKKARIYWQRPLWWAVKARTALDQADYQTAIKYARSGLGAADDRGDLRVLPGLYRVIGAALEANPDTVDDARDARQRSVNAARSRASRLELAHALLGLGQHFKQYYKRLTHQARGSGYLFEADQIYREAGISEPGGIPGDTAHR